MAKSKTRKLTSREEKYLNKLFDECGWRLADYIRKRKSAVEYEIRHCGCRSYPNCEDDPGGCSTYNRM